MEKSKVYYVKEINTKIRKEGGQFGELALSDCNRKKMIVTWRPVGGRKKESN